MPAITRAEAQMPFVLTLDVGSSSLRVGLFDALGRTIEGQEFKTTYSLETTADGGAFFDAESLVKTVVDGISNALHKMGDLAQHIQAVAMDTFWHSIVGVDDAGKAITPLLTWADTRSHDDAIALRKEVDAEAVHQRTGCLVHATYPAAKLRWLARTQPETFKRAKLWLSFGEYLYLCLFGRPGISLSMASGTGLFDQAACRWDAEMLKLCGISAEQLTPLDEADAPLEGLKEEYAKRWPALAKIGWYPAYGDGATSNIGSGCYTPDKIAVNIGTSGAMRIVLEKEVPQIPPSLWLYRVDRRRVVVGGALSNGGNVYAWLKQTLHFDALEKEEEQIANMEPDSHGLTILPFLAGERAPGYAANARATISGINLDTSPHEIMRAALEAVMYRFYAVYSELCKVTPHAQEVIASGNALLKSPTWQHILGDVLNSPIQPSCETEATSRGAALLVLERLGVLQSFDAAAFEFDTTYTPDAGHYAIYQKAIARQQELYDILIAPTQTTM